MAIVCRLEGEVVVIAGAQGGAGSAGDDREVLVELKRFLQENNRVNRGAVRVARRGLRRRRPRRVA